MIKLIIFDLWKTLAYRAGEPAHGSIKKIIQKEGIEKSVDEVTKIFEETVQTKKWKSEFKAYKKFCQNLGLKVTKENVHLLEKIRDHYEKKENLYSFTIPLLKELRDKGYKLGLITNSTSFSIRRLHNKTELLRQIDYPLFSFNIGLIKPDKLFYEKMLKKARVKAEETLMIGDSEINDVKIPRQLGMNAIHFKNTSQLKKDLKKFGVK